MESSGTLMGALADLLIFTEASPLIGHGHVRRCLALADEAAKRGLKVKFAVTGKYAADIVHAGGHKAYGGVEELAPFIIRDFRNGSVAEEVAREMDLGSRVMLLDERGTARACATIVTDTFMTPQWAEQYVHAPGVSYLYGFEYAPLRSQFSLAALKKLSSFSADGHLLVAFGGSDPLGITQRYIQALDDCGFRGPATIVVDSTPVGYREASALTASWKDTEVRQNVKDMAGLMNRSTLVATKVGITLLESFCLGKGCVFIEPSPAHVLLEAELARHYPSWPAFEFGLAAEVDFIKAALKTMEILADFESMRRMGLVAASLVDGQGTVRLMDILTGEN